MANSLGSNTTEKLMKIFAKSFESNRVVTKTVDTQMISGSDIDASTGGTVSVKRPHDYVSHRTAAGDISGVTKSDIKAGKATATVQNWITVATEWSSHEEALDLEGLTKIIAPMATRATTDLEVSLAEFMRNNGGLSVGSPGTAVNDWEDVASAGAMLSATGVPMDSPCYYVMDPFTMSTLAGVQHGLSPGDGPLVKTAWEKAQTSGEVGGLQVYSSNALKSFSTGAFADLAGALSADPVVTYAGAKDTMTQILAVDLLTNDAVVKAGSIVEITAASGSCSRLNVATKEPILDGSGALVKWRATVTADVTLSGTGTGSLVVSGPAIFEAAPGAYNTVSQAPVDNDVVTILNAASTTFQPNLFYKRDAFGLATVQLPKLYSTDTTYVSEDGITIRCSKYADGDASKQKIRFDIVPAFTCFNPLFAGQGHGS